MNKKIYLGLIFILLILNSLVFASAITASMGNAKMILYPEVGMSGATIERSILVKNINDKPINIRLEASDDFKKFVEILDDNFTLQPEESRKAQFVITLKNDKDIDGKINVFFTSDEKGESGVVLSSTILIRPEKKGFFDFLKDDEDGEDSDEEVEGEDGDLITGNVLAENNNSEGLAILGVSTLIMMIVLLFLLVLVIKRSGKITGSKRKSLNSSASEKGSERKKAGRGVKK